MVYHSKNKVGLSQFAIGFIRESDSRVVKMYPGLNFHRNRLQHKYKVDDESTANNTGRKPINPLVAGVLQSDQGQVCYNTQ
jgi:hypothetical protein